VVLDVDEETTVLDAALDAGIDLPHDCKLGVCLTCPSKVISGSVDQSTGSLDDSVQAQVNNFAVPSYYGSDNIELSYSRDMR